MANEEATRSRAWWWIAALVAASVVVSIVYRSSHGVVEVRVAKVELRDISTTVSTNGKVQPVDDFQAHAPMPGVVEKLYVGAGQQVSPGQLLVAMDDSDARKNVASAEASLESARAGLGNMRSGGTQDELLSERADMKSAQAQVEQTTTALAAMEQLQARGAASANEVSQARQRKSDAQAKVTSLQARRNGRYSASDLSTQQAQVRQAQTGLDAARSGYAGINIRAPFAGTVYAVPVAQYDFVQAGEALLDVADLARLEVHAYFDEPDTGKLAKGQPVTIVWAAKPNAVWHGHIVEAPTTIIEYRSTRNVGECIISVEDARGDLLPNTNVTVNVTTMSKPNVLSLPREALRTSGTSSNYVYRVVEDRLVRTPVRVGVVNVDHVEITGGLTEGDVVALGSTDQTELTDNLRAKARR